MTDSIEPTESLPDPDDYQGYVPMRKGRKRNLEREAEAKKLRMQGKSLTQIAKEMGYEGNGSVWNYLNRPN